MTFFSYKNLLLVAIAFIAYVLVVGAFAYGQTYNDDFDYDNIWNSEDLCPEEIEDLNGYKDKDGCPDNEEFQLLFDWIIIIEGYEVKQVSAEELPFEDDVMRIEYDIDFENNIIYLEKGFNNFIPVDYEASILDRIKADIDIKKHWDGLLNISLGNLEVKPLITEIEVRGHGHREVIIDGVTIVEEYPWIPIQVEYISDENPPCGHKYYQACFIHTNEEMKMVFYASHNVFFKPHGKINPDIIGLSEFEHETLHAWGVNHAEMDRWFNLEIPRICPCPLFPHTMNGQYIR